jgi:hypothetical protein
MEAGEPTRPHRPVFGLGLAAIVASTVLVVTLRSPALPVAIVDRNPSRRPNAGQPLGTLRTESCRAKIFMIYSSCNK